MTHLPLLKQGALDAELRRALHGSLAEPSAEELGLLTSKLSAALALPLAVPAAQVGVSSTSKIMGLASAQKTLSLWKLGVWVMGGVALGVGLSAAATATFSVSDSPTPPTRASHPAAARAPGLGADPTPEPAGPLDTATPVAPSAAAPVPTTARTAIATDELVLPEGDELSLLHRAQQALVADPARALQLAISHETAFPQGALAQERDVIEIDALLRLRRLPEAEASARSFTQKYPGSAHAARVEQLLIRVRSR